MLKIVLIMCKDNAFVTMAMRWWCKNVAWWWWIPMRRQRKCQCRASRNPFSRREGCKAPESQWDRYGHRLDFLSAKFGFPQNRVKDLLAPHTGAVLQIWRRKWKVGRYVCGVTRRRRTAHVWAGNLRETCAGILKSSLPSSHSYQLHFPTFIIVQQPLFPCDWFVNTLEAVDKCISVRRSISDFSMTNFAFLWAKVT